MIRNLFFALAAVALVFGASNVWADPAFEPFIAVDINGGQGTAGPTQTDWASWNVLDGAGDEDEPFGWCCANTAGFDTINKSFASASVLSGQIDVSIQGVGVALAARNRNTPPVANDTATGDEPLGRMYRDFIFASRDTNIGFGRHYLHLHFDGLDADKKYEFTMFSYDSFSSGVEPNRGAMAWSDLNPADWLDANVGAGANYQPAPGYVNNPIPILGRSWDTGPWPSGNGGYVAGTYSYAASFVVAADGNGEADVYGWADPESYSTQTISLINGFQIGCVPEPASILLLGFGLVGFALHRRRRS